MSSVRVLGLDFVSKLNFLMEKRGDLGPFRRYVSTIKDVREVHSQV